MKEDSTHRISTFSDALPSGWASATVGELVGRDGLFVDGDWVESKDQDPWGDVRLIQLADVGDGAYLNKSNRSLTNSKAIELRCTFLKPDDLLIARMPEPLGRACIFPGDSKPCITVVDVCIVRTGVRGASKHWLMHAINSLAVRSVIEGLQSGSTRKRISRSNLAKLEVPLPPLPEQHRIVAKIEELFTRLDAGVEALKKIKAQLKRYRQSVLKHAFQGKLTEEWRQTHKDDLEPASVLLEHIKQERQKTAKGKYKEIPSLDTSNLPELPDGWVWARVGDMSVVMGGKRLPKGHQYADVDTGMPYIRVTDFRNMTVDMTNLKFLKQETKGLISRYTISREDLYISIAGSIGKVGTVPDRLDDANLTENAAKITDLHNDKRYMCYVLNSSFCREQILRLIVSSNQPKLALFRIEQIVFPLNPPSEQHQIVSEIERRFSVADAIEKNVDQSLKQAERLRQSILKRAFEGKLVPQNPNDEPAEKLLERIRQERARQQAEREPAKSSRSKLNTKRMRLV